MFSRRRGNEDERRRRGAVLVAISALAALAIPGALLLAFCTLDLDELLNRILPNRRLVRWTALAGAFLLAAECYGGSVLARLILAGGSISRLVALESEPARIALRRRRKFRAVAAALACLSALGLAEAVFRVFDIRPAAAAPSPYLEADLVDNARNPLGLREPWDALAEDDARWRVAVLGDSMTFGDAVEWDATFCHQMEALLSGVVPGGVVTINMGKPGTVPGEQLELYRRVGPSVRPDVVLQVVYPNDLDVDCYGMLRNIYRIRDDALYVGEWSYVLRFVEKQIRYWVAWNRTIDYFRGGRDAAHRERAWVKFSGDVRACRDAVRADGADYALVLFPWLFRLDDYLLKDVHERMGRFARDLGVPYLDLLDTFTGRDDENLRVSPANEHPNREGHRIAAERLSRFVLEVMLPRREARPAAP